MLRKFSSAHALVGIVAGTVLCHLLGCSSPLDATRFEKTVKRQEDAGSTYVAVLSSARFDDYRDALQPTFTMSSADALAQAIPNTLLEEERIVDAFKAALKVAAPGTSITTTDTTTAKTGAPTEKKSERIEKTEPGDVSKIAFGDSPAKDEDLSKLAPKDSVVTGQVGVDPMLRHLVATALYQEVQMLNRYVRDAARGNGEYDAHVVRLQVGIMPRTRNLPYDVYTTISFFNGDFECSGQTEAPTKVVPEPEVKAAIDRAYWRAIPKADKAPQLQLQLQSDLVSSLKGGEEEVQMRAENITKALASAQRVTAEQASDFTKALKEEFACRLHGGAESAPQVVPLLVTDSIEAATHSRSVDELRQFLLGLSAMVQGFGASADIQQLNQNIRNVLGRDYNSTFTVGRISDNTIRVRFGAIQNPNMAYTMVPQTHNVTLLVLVPKTPMSGGAVRFVSRAEFVHARTGTVTDIRTSDDVRNIARRLLLDHGVTKKMLKNDQTLDQLSQETMKLVDRNDYAGFKRFVEEQVRGFEADETLWLDVVNAKSGGRYASGRVLLQNAKTPVINPNQNPVIIDDGEKNATVMLSGVKDLLGTAALIPSIQVESKSIPPSSVALIDNGSRLVMAFPSLKAMGIKVDAAKRVQVLSDSPAVIFPAKDAGYQLTKMDQPKSAAMVSASAKVIRSAADGTGTVYASFTAKEGAIIVKIDGADIRSASAMGDKGPALTSDVGKWILASSSNVQLNLANLDPASPVTISASSPKDAEGTAASKVTFTVSAAPKVEQKKE